MMAGRNRCKGLVEELGGLLPTEGAFVYVRNPIFEILAISENFERLLGYSQTKVAQDFHSLLSETSLNRDLVALLRSRKRSIPPLHAFIHLRDKWGMLHTFEIYERKCEQTEDSDKIIGIAVDANDKVKLMDEVAKLREHTAAVKRMRSVIINHIAHKIKNPLQVLLGLLLSEGAIGEGGAPQGLVAVQNAAVELADMLEMLLEWSKLESGSEAVLFTPVNLETLVDEIVSRYAPACKLAGIELRTHIATELKGKLIETDESKLKLILHSLVAHAVKAAAKQPVELEFGLNKEAAGQVLVVTVRHSGKALGWNELIDVFNAALVSELPPEEFKRIRLELPVADRLCRLLGGTLSMRELKHGGAECEVKIPVNVKDKVSAERTARLKRERLYPVRVLIVENEDAIREGLMLSLRDAGIEAFGSEDGVYALQTLNLAPFDVVVLDLHLPDMSGEEFIERLNATGKTPKLIIITGASDLKRLERLRESGVYILRKPFTSRELLDAVDSVLTDEQ